jgi:hypothetical protein
MQLAFILLAYYEHDTFQRTEFLFRWTLHFSIPLDGVSLL